MKTLEHIQSGSLTICNQTCFSFSV